MQASRSEEERRRALARLYPNEKLPAKDRPRTSEVRALDTDGVLAQPWGPIALVDVQGADGPLEATLKPLAGPETPTELVVARCQLPLGAVLEEAGEDGQGPVVVVELAPGGGADGRLQPGDLLRGCTACVPAMSYPAWQVMLGGVGRPSVQKRLVDLSREPLEQAMAAIRTNAEGSPGANGQVILLVERKVGGGEAPGEPEV